MGCRLERIRTRRTGVRMSPTGRRRPKPQAIRGLEASLSQNPPFTINRKPASWCQELAA
jgi:hypothetical protein